MNKNEDNTINTCIICGTKTDILEDKELHIHYDVCPECQFIYKQKSYHPSWDEEQKRYEQHHNDEQNIGYKTYLESFVKLHVRPLKNVKTILDFGSGPYPMLKKLLQFEGYTVYDFDPFFNDNKDYLDRKYDLIILTEVLEHVHDPLSVLQRIIGLLNDDGRILILTQFCSSNTDTFLTWWYRRDITHVSFFNKTTFMAICDMLPLKIESTNDKDVMVLRTI